MFHLKNHSLLNNFIKEHPAYHEIFSEMQNIASKKWMLINEISKTSVLAAIEAYRTIAGPCIVLNVECRIIWNLILRGEDERRNQSEIAMKVHFGLGIFHQFFQFQSFKIVGIFLNIYWCNRIISFRFSLKVSVHHWNVPFSIWTEVKM